ncbi:MAG: Si-specific NAD(P)(+) transhydrogenase, partial [Deltaproteobacteria bacterium]|nr:Si-specific NAD(P)(+) transhydrogenase [Deltaproteobacteria bacterium]
IAEQGRRAARHALGLPVPAAWEGLPFAVYSVPELASAGLTEAEARARHGAVRVGRAELATVVRGLISGVGDGLLKLVVDPAGERLLGVHVAGEGASELVHLGLVAMRAGLGPAALGELPFNFPTLAEAYPIAVRGLR